MISYLLVCTVFHRNGSIATQLGSAAHQLKYLRS
eukprot:COSAG02_NODE_48139_length_336_cov_0.641350_1_plen_33_part_01